MLLGRAIPLPPAGRGQGWGSCRAFRGAAKDTETPTPCPSPQGGGEPPAWSRPPQRSGSAGVAFAVSAWATTLASYVPAKAHADEPLPVIVTYKMRKARLDAHAVRDPKGFWIHQVAQRIEEKKATLKSPLATPLIVDVAFIVGRDGAILHSEIKRSSGNAAVDETALAMVARAGPFPPMPNAVTESQLAFDLPLRFH